MATRNPIDEIVRILRDEVRAMRLPIVTELSRLRHNPFEVLVSTVISLRTKDEVTRESASRLLDAADTPEAILALPEEEIARLIYPAGFYKTKAKTLRTISRLLLENHFGKVPDTLEALLELPGVGRKTANLVITLGFGQLGVCVDTHVHRISNRLGYVTTKTPEETEMALRDRLPQEYWIEYNDLLVTWGQNVCKPISPFCSKCAVQPYCGQVGVMKHR